MPNPTSESIAKDFADYFIGKINRICSDLDKHEKYKLLHISLNQTLSNFKPITNNSVIKIINSMTTKSCESDPIPNTIFKKVASFIIDEITAIINISLLEGVFADQWKNAIVHPLPKKAGLDHTLQNYRPVSNLPFLSKVVEKCMVEQLTTHCMHPDLMPDYQSAYRTNYSCEMALVKLTSDILNAMEYQRATALVVLNMSVDCDTVDHGILLEVLNHRFGIDGSALDWYNSYLQGRTMRVYCNGQIAKPKHLHASVPQGSCGGPVLYLIYASTIQDNIPPTIDLQTFADDYGLKNHFNTGETVLEQNAILDLENCVCDVNSWMNKNRLKINASKSDHIIFCSRKCLKN